MRQLPAFVGIGDSGRSDISEHVDDLLAGALPTADAAFLDSVGMGPDYTFQLVELVDSDLRRMAGLVRQYASLRLGGTDASVIAICERLGIATIATVNLRDFTTVRPRHIPAFM